MANAKAQHQLVSALVDEFPQLAYPVTQIAGITLPEHDQVVPDSNTHQDPAGPPIETDATLRLLRGGKPQQFLHVEMQRRYNFDKLATLHAYHGSEVRKAGCGGHVLVLSPQEAEAAKFRAADAAHHEELAYRGTYMSGADLAPLAGPGRPLPERALAAAMSDLRGKPVPPGARALLVELSELSKLAADLYMKTILEECDGLAGLEAGMSDTARERLLTLPTFREWHEETERHALQRGLNRGLEQGIQQGKEEGELEALRTALTSYFASRSDTPSEPAITQIGACANPVTLRSWLTRAYNGETSAHIFGGNLRRLRKAKPALWRGWARHRSGRPGQ